MASFYLLPLLAKLPLPMRKTLVHLFVLYQLLQHHYRLILFIRAVAITAWIGLVALYFTGHLHHHLGAYMASLIVGESGFPILVPRLRGLLRTLYCVGSRMWIVLTLAVSMLALTACIINSENLLMATIPALSFWAYVRLAFYCHKQFRPYLIDWNGVNPMSRDGKRAWLCPPAKAIKRLFPGRVKVVVTAHPTARIFHESDGHAEISDDDELWSSVFEHGVYHLDIDTRAEQLKNDKERYFVLYTKKELSDEQMVEMRALLWQFYDANKKWVKEQNEFRRKLIGLVPFVSEATKIKWAEQWQVTGYDFGALPHGDRSSVIFTCVSFVVRVLQHFNLNERQYEVDMFGIPFGILVPPIFPWQLMDDNGLELFTEEDQKRFEEEEGITLPAPPIPPDVLNRKPNKVHEVWVAGEKVALKVGEGIGGAIKPLLNKKTDKAA
jgi:hypothetical protein